MTPEQTLAPCGYAGCDGSHANHPSEQWDNGTQTFVTWTAVCHYCDWRRDGLHSEAQAREFAKTHWGARHA